MKSRTCAFDPQSLTGHIDLMAKKSKNPDRNSWIEGTLQHGINTLQCTYNGFQIAFAHSATNKRSTLYNLTSNDNRQDESNLQQIQMVFDIFRPFSDHRSAVPFRTHHIHSPKDEKKDTKKDGIQPSDAMSDTI